LAAWLPRLNFGRDVGLQVRMLFTVALLGLLYIVLVVALLAAGSAWRSCW
jgi:hypothetical protein